MNTPFPTIPGSPVSKTEDRYFCRKCCNVALADYIDATGVTTCALCDSTDVITAERHGREQREQRDATFARMDREADERAIARAHSALDQLVEIARSSCELPAYSEGFLRRRQAGGAS